MLLVLGCHLAVMAQTDTAAAVQVPSVFERLSKGMMQYKLDTTAVPNDKVTRQIDELRRLRGGFNINEAIDFKLEEDRRNGALPPQQLDSLAYFFREGNGKRWLYNATNHIYRNFFIYKELKQLVKFYKTSAGQKMAENFPLIMLQSLAAAEMLKNAFVQPTGK